VLPGVRPVMVQVVAGALTVHEAPPGVAVIVYDKIGDPPSLVGGDSVIVAERLPTVTVSMVGGFGTLSGVTATVASDESEVPTPLVAVTTKVYAVPFVKPEIIIGAALPDAVAPPGDAVTVYDVIDDPLFAGAVKLTLAPPFIGVATGDIGALGRFAGVTDDDGADAVPIPAAVIAWTVNV